MTITQTRRRFLTTAALTGAACLARVPRALGAEGPLESTAIRVVKNQGICYAPQYVAEPLLSDEGFTDIRFVETPPPEIGAAIALGKVDFGLSYAPLFARDIDAGTAVTVIAGVMVGCTELFTRDGIHSITDLKGKSVGIQALGSLPNVLVFLMAAYVGLDPDKDIHWVTDPKVKPKELFIDGKIDAFLGFPPEPQELHARGIGHVTSIPRSTARGRNITAACWAATRNTSATTRSPASGRCAPSSRRRIYARRTRRARRGGSSIAASPRDTTMPCRL
jgi:NitT/TauT family transport system substrate-binding protein